MSTSHFVVSQRDNAWQVSFKGDVTAPFDSRDAAIEAAIAMAGAAGNHEVEVVVQDADLRTETVWPARQPELSDSESAQFAEDIEQNRDA